MGGRTAGLNVEVLNSAPPLVRLTGEADFHNKHQISEVFDRLVKRGQATIQADLSELDYIDSSGLSALVGCAAKASEAGGAIELLGVSERVSRMLTLCGAAAFFRTSLPDVPVCGEGKTMSPAEGFWHVSEFNLSATPDAAAVARGRVADVIRGLPLTLGEGQDVLVAVGEALANAIRHGCGCNPDMTISIRCVAGPSRLAVDVTDHGPGFDPGIVGSPSPQSLSEGGMGIYMMRQIMDEVSFSFGDGTTVRLVKYINRVASDDNVNTDEMAGV